MRPINLPSAILLIGWCACATASTPRSATSLHPDRTAVQLAQRMLDRCRTARGVIFRSSFSGGPIGAPGQHTSLIHFQRPSAPHAGFRLRAQIASQHQRFEIGLNGDRYTLWFPSQNQVTRGELQPSRARRWDAFAHPIPSVLAMLAPGDDDQAALDRWFVQRARALPSASFDGARCDVLGFRGAFGIRVECFLAAEDGSPRRILLRPPDTEVEGLQCEIVFEHFGAPINSALLECAVPRDATDLTRGPDRPAGADSSTSIEDPLPRLRRATASAAKSPRSAAFQEDLAGALQAAGHQRAAVAALHRALALEPTLSRFQHAWQMSVEMSDKQAAARFLILGIGKYGEQLLDRLDGMEQDPVEILAGAGATAAVADVLRPRLAATRETWQVDAWMARLALAQPDSEALAKHWHSLIRASAPWSGPRARAITRVAQTMDLEQWSWPAHLRRDASGALAAAEPWARAAVSSADGLLLATWAGLYMGADAAADAARVLEEIGVTGADLGLVIHTAVALRRHGHVQRSDQLFRLVLLEAVQEPINHHVLLELLDTPEGSEALRPVLGRLGAAEQAADPLTAATWFFLAGRPVDAALASQSWLASSDGSPEMAPASRRLLAAILGLIAVQQSNDLPNAQRQLLTTHHSAPATGSWQAAHFSALAMDEFGLAEMEMGTSPPVVEALLYGSRGADVLPSVLHLAGKRLGERWLDAKVDAAAGLTSADLNGLLGRWMPEHRPPGVRQAALAERLVALGRPEIALPLALEALASAPRSLRPAAIERLCSQADGEPILAALRAAVHSTPGWDEGPSILAECLLAAGASDSARRELGDFASSAKTAAALKNLARLDWRLGRRGEAVNGLRDIVSANPEDHSTLTLLARWLSRPGGDPVSSSAAVSAWRRLSAAKDAGRVLEAAIALRYAGFGDEAYRILEREVAGAAKAEGDAPAVARALLAELRVERGMPQRALGLYPGLVALAKAGEMTRDELGSRADCAGLPAIARALAAVDEEPAAIRTMAAAIREEVATSADLLWYLRRCGPANRQQALRLISDLETSSGSPSGWSLLIHVAQQLLEPTLQSPALLATLTSAVRPEGSEVPHISRAAALACEGLAASAVSRGDVSDANRYAAWTAAMAIADADRDARLGAARTSADLERASALFPESPCLALRLLAADRRETLASSWTPDERQRLARALRLLAAAPSRIMDCSTCSRALHELEASGSAVSTAFESLLQPVSPSTRHFNTPSLQHSRIDAVAGQVLAGLSERRPALRVRARQILRRAAGSEPLAASVWAALRDLAAGDPAAAAEQLESARKVAVLRPTDAYEQIALADACDRLRHRTESGDARRKARELDSLSAFPVLLQRMSRGADGQRRWVSMSGSDSAGQAVEAEALLCRALASLDTSEAQLGAWLAPGIQGVLGPARAPLR